MFIKKRTRTNQNTYKINIYSSPTWAKKSIIKAMMGTQVPHRGTQHEESPVPSENGFLYINAKLIK